MQDKNHIVISLGGSLIVPDGVDTNFLSQFVSLIKDFTTKDYKFTIITGGGHKAREYIEASKQLTTPSNTDMDWIGIATTRLNSELIRVAFGEFAHEKIIMDPDNVEVTSKPVMLGAGWKPGNSSDLAAVHVAKSVGAKVVINLSNIDYAYDKDPKKFPDAVKMENASWAEFRKILPDAWNPGLNAPFDPVAAREAEALGLEVVIMNGKNIENLKAYLSGEKFIGSVIK